MPDLKEQLYPSWPAQVVAHPMVSSPDEDKYHYLQVLTLLIDADDVILDEEIEYLRRMVQIFGLENGTVGKLIKFVQLPETDEMRKIFIICLGKFPLSMNVLNYEKFYYFTTITISFIYSIFFILLWD